MSTFSKIIAVEIDNDRKWNMCLRKHLEMLSSQQKVLPYNYTDVLMPDMCNGT